MSTIGITRLTKRFGGVVALDEVDVDVADGEFLTVLGPSGSGKSTLLLTVAGFEDPTSGQIHIDGRDVTAVPAHRRQIGLTFQSYALFPHMSVQANVEFPLRVRGIPRSQRRQRVEGALDLVRLRGLEDRRPHELSGGQQQRVALARAFVFEPDLLLLDEPLAALDRQLRQTVQVELGELQRSLGLTTIAVTHDQEEALTMSDRILVLDRGRVQQHGPPEEVYRKPGSTFVASFLGTANLFTGTVQRGADDWVLQWQDGQRELPVGGPGRDGPVTAMLRPEQIRLLAPEHGQRGGASASGRERRGELAGEIQTVVYLGVTTRYRVRTETGFVVEVTEPGTRRFAVSDRVVLNWRPEDVWLIPSAPAAVVPDVGPVATEAESRPTVGLLNGAST